MHKGDVAVLVSDRDLARKFASRADNSGFKSKLVIGSPSSLLIGYWSGPNWAAPAAVATTQTTATSQIIVGALLRHYAFGSGFQFEGSSEQCTRVIALGCLEQFGGRTSSTALP